MAERRMFTKKITDADAFIEMSSAAQALYFHLNQGADDDGFNNQVNLAMVKAHASNDDLKILLAKGYLVRFDSGVIVIKHWRMHNYIRQDRYKPTSHTKEMALLVIRENGSYAEKIHYIETEETVGRPLVNQRLPQDSLKLDQIKDSGSDSTINTTTTTFSKECAGAGAPAREKKDTSVPPPTASEVYAYMTEELGEEVTATEADKFVSWNERWGWDCLPNWKGAAALWCARIPERSK